MTADQAMIQVHLPVQIIDMQRVYATEDDDGHWYVIPFEMKDEFLSDLEGLGDDNIYEWEDKYSKYMTGGDLNLIPLYAELSN